MIDIPVEPRSYQIDAAWRRRQGGEGGGDSRPASKRERAAKGCKRCKKCIVFCAISFSCRGRRGRREEGERAVETSLLIPQKGNTVSPVYPIGEMVGWRLRPYVVPGVKRVFTMGKWLGGSGREFA